MYHALYDLAQGEESKEAARFLYMISTRVITCHQACARTPSQYEFRDIYKSFVEQGKAIYHSLVSYRESSNTTGQNRKVSTIGPGAQSIEA